MTIQEIKLQLPILRVLSHYGLAANKNHMLLCPLHDDKVPSLQVYPKSNSYCCFSTKCEGGSGDQLQLLEKLEVKYGRVSGDSKAVKHHSIQLAKELLGYREESLLEVFTKMRSALKRSKKAQAYALGRSLDIENLEVGYNGGFYKDLKNCLVFPLKDHLGGIASFYGRSISDGGRSRHFYQKGRSGLYPGYPDKKTKRLILTEGVIDAASLLEKGGLEKGTSVLALYGAKVLTPEQESALKSLKELEELILFFDGDEAGRLAVSKWEKDLNELLNKTKN